MLTASTTFDVSAGRFALFRVVRFPGIGHDVYMESECGRTVVADFLSRPDSYDAGCVDMTRKPDFVT